MSAADLSPYALDPFGPSANPGAYVANEASERARAALERALDAGRVGAVVGPPGHGKTLLLRLLGGREEDRARVAYVPFPSLDADELFALVLNALGARRAGPPREALLSLSRELAPRGGIVILVDDANDLSDASAKALASLLEEAKGALRIGLAAVEGPDARRVLRAFGPRLEVVHLADGMSQREARRYVEMRLAYGGARPELVAAFDARTIERLHRSSQGVPRRLNQVAQDVVRRAVPSTMPRLRDLSFEPEPPEEAVPESAADVATPPSVIPPRLEAVPSPPPILPRQWRAEEPEEPAPVAVAATAAPVAASEEPPRPWTTLRSEEAREEPLGDPVEERVEEPIEEAVEEPIEERAAAPAPVSSEPERETEPAEEAAVAAASEAAAEPGEDEADIVPEEPPPSETVPWFRPLRSSFPTSHASRRPGGADAEHLAAPHADPEPEIDAPHVAAPSPPPVPPATAAPSIAEQILARRPAPTPKPTLPPPEPAPEPFLQDEEGILLARPDPVEPMGEYRLVRGRSVAPPPGLSSRHVAQPSGAAASLPRTAPALRRPEPLPAASRGPRMGVIGVIGFAIGVLVALLFTFSEVPTWAGRRDAPWERSRPRPVPSAPAPSTSVAPTPVAEPTPPAPAPAEEEGLAAQPVAPAAPPAPAASVPSAPAPPAPVIAPPAPPEPAPAPAPVATPEAIAPAPEPVAPAPAVELVSVSINATPWAIVRVDGRELGETPLAGVRLAPGPHVFSARMPDGSTREQRLEIGPGRDTVVFE